MQLDLEFDEAFRTAVCAPANRGGLAVAASNAAVALECANEIHESRASGALLDAITDYSEELGRDPDPATRLVLHNHLQDEVYGHFARPVTISAPEETLTRLRAYVGFALAEALVYRKKISAEFLHAVSMIQRSYMGRERGSKEWRRIAMCLPMTPQEADALARTTQDPVVLTFLADLGRLLSRPLMPAPGAAMEVEDGSGGGRGDTNKDTEPSAEDVEEDETEPEDELSAESAYSGDLLAWHSRRAEFASYRDAMGLEVAYGRLPPEYLRTVTGRLVLDILGPGAHAQYARVGLWTMLLGAPPLHALQVKIYNDDGGRTAPDVSLYVSASGHIVWRLDRFLNERAETEPRCVRIPIPTRLFAVCKLQCAPSLDLQDLLNVPGKEDKSSWTEWLRGYRRYLASVGDDVYRVTPARLAYSLGAIYLAQTGQDLLSAAMSLNFALTPRTAFHYIYVLAAQCVAASNKVYDLLGLGPPCELPRGYQGFGSKNSLSKQEFEAGWAKLLEETARSWAAFEASETPHEIRATWAQLVVCNLLLLCTAQGRRITRIGRITFGTLLTLEDATFEDDKDVLEAPVERLLPKTPAVRALIDWHRACVTLLARKIVSLGAEDDAVLAMASGLAPYHKAAFFECETTYVEGVPYFYRRAVLPGSLDALARRCFRREGNVGRHFWPTEMHKAGVDRMLTRVLTHHQRPGAEVGHCVMTMSTQVVVAELGRVMHQLAPLEVHLPAHAVAEPLINVRELPLPQRPLTRH